MATARKKKPTDERLITITSIRKDYKREVIGVEAAAEETKLDVKTIESHLNGSLINGYKFTK